jgi:hypothetical protein
VNDIVSYEPDNILNVDGKHDKARYALEEAPYPAICFIGVIG